MLSQQHNNIHWPEEETPPSLDQKQTVPSTSTWRGWSLWLRILGVVIALVSGFALLFLQTPDEASWNVFLLLVVLVGVVSAALLRSWWAMLIIPIAFDLGHALSESFQYGFDTFLPSLVFGVVLLFIVLVEIGVLIGTPIGKKIEQRLQH
jgi:hypothetical protein